MLVSQLPSSQLLATDRHRRLGGTAAQGVAHEWPTLYAKYPLPCRLPLRTHFGYAWLIFNKFSREEFALDHGHLAANVECTAVHTPVPDVAGPQSKVCMCVGGVVGEGGRLGRVAGRAPMLGSLLPHHHHQTQTSSHYGIVPGHAIQADTACDDATCSGARSSHGEAS